MELQESAIYAGPPIASPEVRSQPLRPAVMAEVERLLGGRTRDVRLKGELGRLFEERSWSRTAKIIRAWMIWVTLLDVLTLGLNAILLPNAVALSMLPPACILPPAALATAFIWRKPRGVGLQRVSLVAGLFLILLSVALVGVSAGGEFYERHLNIMLFVAITAIIIFSIPLAWTVAVASFALALYLIFQLRNPMLDTGSAVAGTLFFTSGIVATVVARRTMTILAQKTFLLELRDKRRVAALADANARLERLAKTGAGAERPAGTAMLMCDIDDFKSLNDRLGHAEGDRCLVKVAGIIQSSVRRNRDHVARYGGEEFLVVLPGADVQAALATAERIRASVEAASLPNPASRVAPYVTLSIGVAAQGAAGEIIGPERLQNQADTALYLAKKAGRNRVVLFRPE
ncbi:diguanylate cyclase [Sinorhizobium medicae]|nr:diguanylate cyclase [Sinorhizobium medicae]MDX0819816.1 diguanylate cyclase [Sinorhizobium medicae]MDX0862811.1 diguanylate cyclase [Sinorhizobium medicae]